MKERRSSKYKNPKRAAVDTIFIVLCLAGSFLGLWFFWTDLNQVLVKGQEKPVGVLSYKRHTVQRRFDNRLFWNQLPKESLVYNGDLVRTAELSDALITFVSEDSVGLSENSLIHILFDEETSAARIELLGGDVSFNSVSGQMIVVAGDRELQAQAGSAFSISGGPENAEIRTVKGSTQIRSPQGLVSLAAGEAANVHGAGNLEITKLPIVTSPRPDMEINALSDQETPVVFAWSTEGLAPDEFIRIEVAADRHFSDPVYSANEYETGEAAVPLGPGIWWWRLFQTTDENAAPPASVQQGRISIIPPPVIAVPEEAPVQLASPLGLAFLTTETPLTMVPAAYESVSEPPVLAVEPEPVQAQPLAAASTPAAQRSAVPSLLPRPFNLWPPNRTLIDGAYLKANRRISFRWNSRAAADAYVFTIRRGTNIDMYLVREPALVLANLAVLENGEYIWQVEPVMLDADGVIERHGETAESRFTLEIPRPAMPRVDNPGIIYGN